MDTASRDQNSVEFFSQGYTVTVHADGTFDISNGFIGLAQKVVRRGLTQVEAAQFVYINGVDGYQ